MEETKSSAGRGVLVVAPVAGAFVPGFIGIALFHQGSGWLFSMIGIYPAQYKTQPIPPFGVPQILSQCFWGALWGIALAWTLAHWRNVNLLAACVRVRPDRSDARGLVRRAAHQRHADHRWSAVDGRGASRPNQGEKRM